MQSTKNRPICDIETPGKLNSTVKLRNWTACKFKTVKEVAVASNSKDGEILK